MKRYVLHYNAFMSYINVFARINIVYNICFKALTSMWTGKCKVLL